MTAGNATRLDSTSETLDWEFAEADTRGLTHGIHRYSGKFIPQIARQAIELLTEPGDLVYDPYCGSGTTLLEAMCAGRRSVGVDLNPLAVLIAKTKVTPVDPDVLDGLWQSALQLPLGETQQPALDIWGIERSRSRGRVEFPEDPYFHKWFTLNVLRDLCIIRSFADDQEDVRLRNILLVAMSDILRKVSRAHQGFPNVMFDKDRIVRTSVRDEFLPRLYDVVQAVKELGTVAPGESDLRPVVIEGKAEDRHLDDASVDAVITHPPYIGSVPYAEYGQLSLKWLGAEPKELDAQLTGGKRQAKDVVSRFRTGYEAMLRAATRAVKPGGTVFLLTGNPTVKGDLVDLFDMTAHIAETVGLHLVYRGERRGKNRRANKMNLETISIWRRL